MFKTTHVLFVLGILVALLVGGVGGFVWGRNVGLSEQINIRTEFFQQRAAAMSGAPSAPSAPGDNPQGAGARGALGQGRQLVNGVVKSVEGNTVTVTQQRDGSTATLTVDDKTVIEKMTSGTLADIKPGWRITAVEQTVGGTTTRRIVLTPGQ
ncbi:MAG: hypothetical protein N2559_00880 [Anaerolineae bacterium]|nr:hypothetical protein [Anaerolineae bacterium]